MSPTYAAIILRSDAARDVAALGRIGRVSDKLQTLLAKIAADEQFRGAVTVSASEKLIVMRLYVLHLARRQAKKQYRLRV
jgi:hypothetical protein